MKFIKKILYLDFHPLEWIRFKLTTWLLQGHQDFVNEQLNNCFKRYDALNNENRQELSAFMTEFRENMRNSLVDEAPERRHKEMVEAIRSLK